MKKILLFILVLLLFGAGFYYLNLKNRQITSVVHSSVSPTTTYAQDLTPFPTVVLSSDWIQYANKQFGYSLSYPQEAQINSGKYSSGGENDYLYATDIRLNLSKATTIPGPLDGYVVTVTTGDFIAPEKGEIRLTTAIDVANHYYGGDKEVNNKVTPITMTTIAGRQVYTYTQYDAGLAGGSGKGYDWVHYFLNKESGNVFMVDIICDSTDPQKLDQYKKIANTIISTFKFD